MALLKVEALRKQFGGVEAVKGISFSLQEGRCTSLLGPNGAGKTTTLKMLSGLLQQTAGTIRFSGWDGDIRQHIGYLPQYPAFYKWMSGREYMEYVGELAGLGRREARERGLQLLELVGLKESAKRRIGGYSGGMKQRLGIAQALIHKPKLLILDEPVSALDPIGRREILELIGLIKQETTILFSTHVLHDAEEVSNDVMIMRGGEILEAGSLEEVRERHRQPLIRIEADQSLESWADGLQARLGKNILSEINVQGRSAQLTAVNMEQAMVGVMADLAAAKVRVRKYEAASSTLEELFMKVVGE
jgi:ABC-2 type transport system ATP-binding protein